MLILSLAAFLATSLTFFYSLQSLYENGVNGILGDEMGLGKTLQCIAVIAYMIERGVKGPFLVAAPLSTVPNWVAEFKKFTPDVSDCVLINSAWRGELQSI